MPNFSFRCSNLKCNLIEDHILPYEESIKEGAVICQQCGQIMKKHFGKAPMIIVPIGTVGNAENGYTAASNVQKK